MPDLTSVHGLRDLRERGGRALCLWLAGRYQNLSLAVDQERALRVFALGPIGFYDHRPGGGLADTVVRVAFVFAEGVHVQPLDLEHVASRLV